MIFLENVIPERDNNRAKFELLLFMILLERFLQSELTIGMGIFKCFRNGLAQLDLFPTQQFLRYKGEPQYKTATGGFCSLVIIIIFVILFTSSGLSVLSKKNVTVSSDTQNQIEPVLSSVTAGPSGNFMVAINVIGIGVFDGVNRNFNVSLQQGSFSQLGAVSNLTDVPLEPCTLDHFSFNSDTVAQYYAFNLNYWLCPPLNYEFTVSGKITSDIYKQFSLYIKKCDSTVYINCAPDSKIANFQSIQGYMSAVVAVITTQLNPSFSENYMTVYAEGRNIFPFSTTLGVRANAEIEDYQIDTDISLLPVTNQVVETGSFISKLFEHYSIPVSKDTYVSINFTKSPNSVTYTRAFQKVDDFLSYVGGLVGIIFGLIFILNSYSELCFEISLGSRLFKYSKQEPIDSNSFNFLVYICYIGFKACRALGCCLNFQMMKIYDDCHEEVEKQIDIAVILQRLSTLQRGMTNLTSIAEFDALFFGEQITLAEAKQLREKLHLCKKYRRKVGERKGEAQRDNETDRNNVSDESSFSQMDSCQFDAMKSQLRQLKSKKGQDCNQFLNNMRKDIVDHLIAKSVHSDRVSQEVKSYIGDDYFRELENQQFKQFSKKGGWGKYLEGSKEDEL